MQFARSLAQGHVVVSDLYSNTQVMTGDVLSSLGSSAAILYYNDTVTYRDGTQEPMDLHVLPMPKTAGADALMTQAGVGLCAYKTTDQKAEAAALFVRWLTENGRNLDFVAQTGYMLVRNGAFDAIENYDKFPEPTESYRQLYAALKIMQEATLPYPSLALRATTERSANFTTACGKCSRSFPPVLLPVKALTHWQRKPGRCCALSIENTVMLKEGDGPCPGFLFPN